MQRLFRIAAAVLITSAAAVAAIPASAQAVPMHLSTPAPYATMGGAHARYSKAAISSDLPDLALTVSVITAGGGAASFDTEKLLGRLTANSTLTQNELAALRQRFAPEDVMSFVKTFNFVIADALAQLTAGGMSLPAAPVPDPTDAKALSTALYSAGLTPRGSFDVEYMLDTLVSHPVHVQVMNDIDANPNRGFRADANYHMVLGAAMLDLKAAYKL